MDKPTIKKLNELKIDVLQEVGNIGSNHAVNALSQMLGVTFTLDIPKVRLMEFQDVYHFLGKVDAIHVGVLVEVKEDINGCFLFLLDETLAISLARQLLQAPAGSLLEMGEMEHSMLREIGNIMCNSYLQAINKLGDLRMHAGVPQLCIDMAGAILNVPINFQGMVVDEILMIENTFQMGEDSFVSHILFLPDDASLEYLFQALGIRA